MLVAKQSKPKKFKHSDKFEWKSTNFNRADQAYHTHYYNSLNSNQVLIVLTAPGSFG